MKETSFLKFNVTFSSPVYSLSGVNTSATYLIRHFLNNGIPSNFLLTDVNPIDFVPLPIPPDIPIESLPVKPDDSWQTCWNALIHYLEKRSPCIYLPGYDWEYSCVSPKLSSQVGIVGVLHSDEQIYYDSVSSLGKYWNAIIAVSETIAEKVIEIDKTFKKKLTVIPYGVPTNSFPKRRLKADAPLKIVYTGRIIQDQKRILDLLKIVNVLMEKQIPFKMTIIGDGLERYHMETALKTLVERNIVKFLGTLSAEETIEHLTNQDVFILTSEFEGFPVSLLEAMSRGCIPVVTDIRSGIPELVGHGINGYRVPIGDIQGFSEHLALLQRNLDLRHKMSLKNFSIIKKGGYNIECIAQRYIKVFQQVMEEITMGSYRRPEGEIHPPYFLDISPYHHRQIQNTYQQLRGIFPILGHHKFLLYAHKFTKFPFLIRILSIVLSPVLRIFQRFLKKHID